MPAFLSADSCSNAVGFMRCAPRAHNSHNIARREPESCMRLRFAGYMACARDVITTATFSVSCFLLCSSTRNSSGVLNVSVLIATQFHKVRSGFLGTHCVMQAASAATAATAASWRITAHNGAQLLGSANCRSLHFIQEWDVRNCCCCSVRTNWRVLDSHLGSVELWLLQHA